MHYARKENSSQLHHKHGYPQNQTYHTNHNPHRLAPTRQVAEGRLLHRFAICGGRCLSAFRRLDSEEAVGVVYAGEKDGEGEECAADYMGVDIGLACVGKLGVGFFEGLDMGFEIAHALSV